MPIDKDNILKRIDELLSKKGNVGSSLTALEIFHGAVSLSELVYGTKSAPLNTLVEINKSPSSQHKAFAAIGALESMKGDIKGGLISSLERQIIGGFFGDFIVMAKQAIDNDYKDVAAVLSSAALEDALKRLGELNGLQLDGKDMSETIGMLKANELLKGSQSKIVSSYVSLRNKALHAEWAKIETPEVKSLIAFTEEFVIQNFS